MQHRESKIIVITILIFICALMRTARADDYLQLLYTIASHRDSTKITSVTSVGDFNVDGYGDLLIGMAGALADTYEVAKLYYGGPGFDTEPDVAFAGDPQNTLYCPGVANLHTLFGSATADIADFNRDGFNDIAISAYGQCSYNFHEGKIYVYFGGTYADTIPDLEIYGRNYTDCFGRELFGGDFNGDGAGDLFTYTTDHYYGQRVYVYIGGANTDTSRYWLYDYSNQDIVIMSLYSGFDLNDDGFADFGWLEFSGNGIDFPILLGGHTRPNPPADTLQEQITFFGDISIDGIDDLISGIGDTNNLYLGGYPFDLIPDYPMPSSMHYPGTIYHMAGGLQVLLFDKNDWGFHIHQLEMYNLGVPFDSVPIGVFDYGHNYSIGCLNIGDINYDGTDEIAICDSENTEVNIYSVLTTGINENSDLPEHSGIIGAYPNPFNLATILTLNFKEKGGDRRIIIYDVLGHSIKEFEIDANQEEESQLKWDATGTSGEKVSSGVYFVRVVTPHYKATLKLTYMK